jgi:hypothetical protein
MQALSGAGIEANGSAWGIARRGVSVGPRGLRARATARALLNRFRNPKLRYVLTFPCAMVPTGLVGTPALADDHGHELRLLIGALD